MPFMYRSDLFCDSCGETIRNRLTRQGKAPADPDDEWSFDSDDYPKHVIASESDYPHHCGAGDECLEAVELESRKIGKLLSAVLTSDGFDYLEEAIAEGGEVAEFWEHAFGCCS